MLLARIVLWGHAPSDSHATTPQSGPHKVAGILGLKWLESLNTEDLQQHWAGQIEQMDPWTKLGRRGSSSHKISWVGDGWKQVGPLPPSLKTAKKSNKKKNLMRLGFADSGFLFFVFS